MHKAFLFEHMVATGTGSVTIGAASGCGTGEPDVIGRYLIGERIDSSSGDFHLLLSLLRLF